MFNVESDCYLDKRVLRYDVFSHSWVVPGCSRPCAPPFGAPCGGPAWTPGRQWVEQAFVCLCKTRTVHTVILISYMVVIQSFETAGLLRPQIFEDVTGIVNGYGRQNRISGCRAAQGPERPGQAAVVRWKRCRIPRLSIQLQNTHEPRQFCFSRADGQMRSRAGNPISLAAARALGEAHLKCCMQMYYALSLITRGRVRTLVRSVEETNGAEVWRLIHSRYAPDTQNRQFAMMQRIMMHAKP